MFATFHLRPLLTIAALLSLAAHSTALQAYEAAKPPYSFEVAYTADLVRNTRGGVEEEGELLSKLDLTAAFDLEEIWGIPGASFSLNVMGIHGNSISDHVGDAQGVNNNDGDQALKLYEALYEQNLSQGRASLKMGLYDLNSEFDVMESAGLFINGSFGIGPEYSQTGVNGPSIFPTTGLAARFRYNFSEAGYAQLAVFEGTPGDPDNPRGTHIDLDSDEGLLVAAELGYATEPGTAAGYRKLAVGTWQYTEDFDDLSRTDINGNPERYSDNRGAYIIGEYQLFQEAGDAQQGLIGFARYGVANEDVNQLGEYWGAGLVYTGLLPSRPEDQFGIAFAHAVNGDHFIDSEQAAGNAFDDAETVIELSYRAPINERLTVQPDVQWVKNPGMDPTLDDALVIGLRLEFALY